MLNNLTPTQRDLALDLILVCRNVSPAFDQQEAFELELQAEAEANGREKVETKEQPCYKEALSEFVDIYKQCEEHGIPIDILDTLTSSFLPVGLCRRLYIKNPP